MEPGDVVEFDEGDDYLLGVLTRDLGQKFIATSEEGDERRPEPSQVTFEFDRRLDPSASRERLADRLSRLRETLDEAVSELDAAFLWEFVRDESHPLSPSDGAEMFFGEADPVRVNAVLQTLRADGVHFSQQDGAFEPRDPDRVEELLEQRRAEERRRRRRDAFVDGVAEMLEAGSDRSPERIEQLRDLEGASERLAALRDYALEDRDSDAREEALELLDDIETAASTQIDGAYGDKAFELLVSLGIWDRHENLALRRSELDAAPAGAVRERAEAIADRVAQVGALEVARELGGFDASAREDLTDLETFSIDARGTVDIDDALSVRRLDDGRREVGVHVADASVWIEAGGAIDEFARQRGSSLYLPTEDLPMLPGRLGGEVASLAAGARRPAVSLLAVFDGEDELDDWRIVPSIVESDRQMTYDEVDDRLGAEGENGGGDRAAARDGEGVEELHRIARTRRRVREGEGGVQIDLPDPELDVSWNDGEPEIVCSIEDDSTPARELVGEYMILANHLFGLFAQRQRVPVIYRTQPEPDGELIDDDVRSAPEGRPRQFQILYNMSPARVRLDPGAHYGLGVPVYAQASSPIRRYADLVTQRQIKAAAADRPPPHDEDEMVELIGDVRRATSEASRVQSETQRYWLLEFMRRADRATWEGTVLDHFDDDGSRGSVWISDVAQKFSCRFRKKIPVGERAELSIERINPRRDDLQLAGEPVPAG